MQISKNQNDQNGIIVHASWIVTRLSIVANPLWKWDPDGYGSHDKGLETETRQNQLVHMDLEGFTCAPASTYPNQRNVHILYFALQKHIHLINTLIIVLNVLMSVWNDLNYLCVQT